MKYATFVSCLSSSLKRTSKAKTRTSVRYNEQFIELHSNSVQFQAEIGTTTI